MTEAANAVIQTVRDPAIRTTVPPTSISRSTPLQVTTPLITTSQEVTLLSAIPAARAIATRTIIPPMDMQEEEPHEIQRAIPAAETHATPAAEVPVMLTAVIPAAGMHAIPAAQMPVMPTDIPTTEVLAVITPAIRREEAPIPQAKRAPATQESMEIIIPQENMKKQVSTLTVPENRRAISCRFPSFSEWA